jgi:hypothetical protein
MSSVIVERMIGWRRKKWMPCITLRHDLGSMTRVCCLGLTNNMHVARITLEAASIRNTMTGLHNAKRNPPDNGPSVDAS